MRDLCFIKLKGYFIGKCAKVWTLKQMLLFKQLNYVIDSYSIDSYSVTVFITFIPSEPNLERKNYLMHIG